MKKFLLCLLVPALPLLYCGSANAQNSYAGSIAGGGGGGGITIGAPITGTCPSGYNIYNNAGVIGCQTDAGSGTVTSVSVATANGVSGTVANPTTTPAITLTLGAITPSSVAIGAGSAITSSGAGGALGTNAFTSTAYAPLASPTFTGTVTMAALSATGAVTLSGLSAGTQVSCLGLSSGNAVVTASCGAGSSTITAGTTATSGITSGNLIGSASNLVTDSGIAYANVALTSAANTFISGQRVQASGATSSNSEILFAVSTSTSGAETLAILNDTSVGRANLVVNNTVSASTTLINMANSAVLDSAGTSSGGLYIGSTVASTNVVLFAGGSVIATNTAMTISGTNQSVTFAAQIAVPAMTQSASAQSGTVCYNTSGGTITYDASLGCLSSLEEMKDIHGPITGALDEVAALKPFWFSPINRPAGSDLAEQPGFGAHQVESVDKRLVGYGANGELRGVRYMEMTALLAAAIKEQQAEISDLKQRIH